MTSRELNCPMLSCSWSCAAPVDPLTAAITRMTWTLHLDQHTPAEIVSALLYSGLSEEEQAVRFRCLFDACSWSSTLRIKPKPDGFWARVGWADEKTQIREFISACRSHLRNSHSRSERRSLVEAKAFR